ncbi:probable insulin-like peptide 3 [Lucilia sericata]|uniref:probable insulin-like peptide 3 n=1 Tax=Lucilia sericata TaxID=13632 RepID=UPI0018A7F54A|nr:probable insulin-like peptide 3 [Lucilia sericata]
MKLLCLFVLIAVIYEANASTKRLCGPVLAQVLESVCINGYNSIKTKKSVPMVHNNLDVLDNYNDMEGEENALAAKHSFLDDLLMVDHINSVAKTRRRRNLFGIYDECCVKGCTFDELTSYCK